MKLTWSEGVYLKYIEHDDNTAMLLHYKGNSCAKPELLPWSAIWSMTSIWPTQLWYKIPSKKVCSILPKVYGIEGLNKTNKTPEQNQNQIFLKKIQSKKYSTVRNKSTCEYWSGAICIIGAACGLHPINNLCACDGEREGTGAPPQRSMWRHHVRNVATSWVRSPVPDLNN